MTIPVLKFNNSRTNLFDGIPFQSVVGEGRKQLLAGLYHYFHCHAVLGALVVTSSARGTELCHRLEVLVAHGFAPVLFGQSLIPGLFHLWLHWIDTRRHGVGVYMCSSKE